MTGPAGHPADAGLVFAHLSDPHLTSLQGVRWRQLMNKRMLGYLSWRRKRRAEHRGEVLDALLEDLQHTRPEHLVLPVTSPTSASRRSFTRRGCG